MGPAPGLRNSRRSFQLSVGQAQVAGHLSQDPLRRLRNAKVIAPRLRRRRNAGQGINLALEAPKVGLGVVHGSAGRGDLATLSPLIGGPTQRAARQAQGFFGVRAMEPPEVQGQSGICAGAGCEHRSRRLPRHHSPRPGGGLLKRSDCAMAGCGPVAPAARPCAPQNHRGPGSDPQHEGQGQGAEPRCPPARSGTGARHQRFSSPVFLSFSSGRPSAVICWPRPRPRGGTSGHGPSAASDSPGPRTASATSSAGTSVPR